MALNKNDTFRLEDTRFMDFDTDVKDRSFITKSIKLIFGPVKAIAKAEAESMDGLMSAKAVFDEFKSEASQQLDEVKNGVKDVLGSLKSIGSTTTDAFKPVMPGFAYRRLKRTFSEQTNEESYDYKESKPEHEIVANNLFGQMAANQVKGTQALLESDAITREANVAYYKADSAAMVQLNSSASSINLFLRNVYTKYLEKDIELKYRSLHAVNDIKSHMDQVVAGLKEDGVFGSIAKNTGSLDKKTANANDKDGKGTNGSTFGNFGNNVVKNAVSGVFNAPKEIVGILGQMLGMTAQEMEANPPTIYDFLLRAPGILPEGIKKKISSVIPGKIRSKYNRFRRRTAERKNVINDDLGFVTENLPLLANKFFRKANRSSSLLSFLFNFPEFQRGRTIENKAAAEPEAAATFDNLTRESIVSVIPKHLERIGDLFEAVADNLNVKVTDDKKMTYDVSQRKLVKTQELQKQANKFIQGDVNFEQDAYNTIMSNLKANGKLDDKTSKELDNNIDAIQSFFFNSGNKAIDIDITALRAFVKGDQLTGTQQEYINDVFKGVKINDAKNAASIIYKSMMSSSNGDYISNQLRRNITRRITSVAKSIDEIDSRRQQVEARGIFLPDDYKMDFSGETTLNTDKVDDKMLSINTPEELLAFFNNENNGVDNSEQLKKLMNQTERLFRSANKDKKSLDIAQHLANATGLNSPLMLAPILKAIGGKVTEKAKDSKVVQQVSGFVANHPAISAVGDKVKNAVNNRLESWNNQAQEEKFVPRGGHLDIVDTEIKDIDEKIDLIQKEFEKQAEKLISAYSDGNMPEEEYFKALDELSKLKEEGERELKARRAVLLVASRANDPNRYPYKDSENVVLGTDQTSLINLVNDKQDKIDKTISLIQDGVSSFVHIGGNKNKKNKDQTVTVTPNNTENQNVTVTPNNETKPLNTQTPDTQTNDTVTVSPVVDNNQQNPAEGEANAEDPDALLDKLIKEKKVSTKGSKKGSITKHLLIASLLGPLGSTYLAYQGYKNNAFGLKTGIGKAVAGVKTGINKASAGVTKAIDTVTFKNKRENFTKDFAAYKENQNVKTRIKEIDKELDDLAKQKADGTIKEDDYNLRVIELKTEKTNLEQQVQQFDKTSNFGKLKTKMFESMTGKGKGLASKVLGWIGGTFGLMKKKNAKAEDVTKALIKRGIDPGIATLIGVVAKPWELQAKGAKAGLKGAGKLLGKLGGPLKKVLGPLGKVGGKLVDKVIPGLGSGGIAGAGGAGALLLPLLAGAAGAGAGFLGSKSSGASTKSGIFSAVTGGLGLASLAAGGPAAPLLLGAMAVNAMREGWNDKKTLKNSWGTDLTATDSQKGATALSNILNYASFGMLNKFGGRKYVDNVAQYSGLSHLVGGVGGIIAGIGGLSKASKRAAMGMAAPMDELEIKKARAKLYTNVKRYKQADKDDPTAAEKLAEAEAKVKEFESAIKEQDWIKARKVSGILVNEDKERSKQWKRIGEGTLNVLTGGMYGLIKNVSNNETPMTQAEIQAALKKFDAMDKRGMNTKELRLKFEEAVGSENWPVARKISGKEHLNWFGRKFGKTGARWAIALGPLGMLGMALFGNNKNEPMSEKEIKAFQDKCAKAIQESGGSNKTVETMLERFNDAVAMEKWEVARKLANQETKSVFSKIFSRKTRTAWLTALGGPIGLLVGLSIDDQHTPMTEKEIMEFRKKMNYLKEQGDVRAPAILEKFEAALAREDWVMARKISGMKHKSVMKRFRNWLAVGLGLKDDDSMPSDEELEKFRASMKRKKDLGDTKADAILEKFEQAVGRRDGKTVRKIMKQFGSQKSGKMSEDSIERARNRLKTLAELGNVEAQEQLKYFEDAIADENYDKAKALAKDYSADVGAADARAALGINSKAGAIMGAISPALSMMFRDKYVSTSSLNKSNIFDEKHQADGKLAERWRFIYNRVNEAIFKYDPYSSASGLAELKALRADMDKAELIELDDEMLYDFEKRLKALDRYAGTFSEYEVEEFTKMSKEKQKVLKRQYAIIENINSAIGKFKNDKHKRKHLQQLLNDVNAIPIDMLDDSVLDMYEDELRTIDNSVMITKEVDSETAEKIKQNVGRLNRARDNVERAIQIVEEEHNCWWPWSPGHKQRNDLRAIIEEMDGIRPEDITEDQFAYWDQATRMVDTKLSSYHFDINKEQDPKAEARYKAYQKLLRAVDDQLNRSRDKKVKKKLNQLRDDILSQPEYNLTDYDLMTWQDMFHEISNMDVDTYIEQNTQVRKFLNEASMNISKVRSQCASLARSTNPKEQEASKAAKTFEKNAIPDIKNRLTTLVSDPTTTYREALEFATQDVRDFVSRWNSIYRTTERGNLEIAAAQTQNSSLNTAAGKATTNLMNEIVSHYLDNIKNPAWFWSKYGVNNGEALKDEINQNWRSRYIENWKHLGPAEQEKKANDFVEGAVKRVIHDFKKKYPDYANKDFKTAAQIEQEQQAEKRRNTTYQFKDSEGTSYSYLDSFLDFYHLREDPEHAISVDANGNLIDAKTGTSNSVRLNTVPGGHVFHNHPGGSPTSLQDVIGARNAQQASITTLRSDPSNIVQGYSKREDIVGNKVAETIELNENKKFNPEIMNTLKDIASKITGIPGSVESSQAAGAAILVGIYNRLGDVIDAVAEHNTKINKSIGNVAASSYDIMRTYTDNTFEKQKVKTIETAFKPSVISINKA